VVSNVFTCEKSGMKHGGVAEASDRYATCLYCHFEVQGVDDAKEQANKHWRETGHEPIVSAEMWLPELPAEEDRCPKSKNTEKRLAHSFVYEGHGKWGACVWCGAEKA
jgi:hypothetical protein